LAIVGTTLIIVGFGLATYSGSFRQWRRRLWLIGLGLLVLAAGALAAGSILVAVAVAAAQNPSSRVPAYPVVAAWVIASVFLVGAITVFVKAWRTPEQPPKQTRWHQVGR
jgi:membrane protein implicated in regulation of membrane protease activity